MQPTRLLLPFLLATATLAQEADESPSARSKRITWPMVTMSFAGGTMTEFVAAVRAAQPKANIVVAEAAAQAALPAIQIKDAGLDQVLESACAVATAADRIRCSEANELSPRTCGRSFPPGTRIASGSRPD